MFNFSAEQIVFQEVPSEVSLAFTITGCQLGCKGCHSVDSWPAHSGTELTESYLKQRLQQYKGLISCVLFLGGEWQPTKLINLLKLARQHQLHTCLYTGLDSISEPIKTELTYLKTGRWQPELGGLNSPTTNQRFIDLRNGACLNHRFIKQ
ncbi:anaerobic ribonucleoside-triphosphate reductase activating protein [Rheinheimera sp. MMS21-TC3]|uniref:anaerobic ribonucleoside-triphosphate reductase activating protein n=1 Tax=Rheinheimera sp. MMS21-TC3 TaxID=3072790 RepID=UPI0028C507DC|nr:anaerobic ribonucleoside-triphosphate reductase activating protein [Rheinheimera sp. MMS21-TC3]WNO60587.1 anaerobic ribonucleoside-triphosphate reductase activating protein [Rheinheimera sp. MMS21-TC3]